jgi:hypothetical protein
MFRLTIRDVLWLTVVVGMGCNQRPPNAVTKLQFDAPRLASRVWGAWASKKTPAEQINKCRIMFLCHCGQMRHGLKVQIREPRLNDK